MLVLYADALLGKGEYKRAKGYYRQVSLRPALKFSSV
jgi:hypothetical protein